MRAQGGLDTCDDAAVTAWAAQKRLVLCGHEGAPSSVLGRIKDQQTAAGEGDPVLRQKWPEVYWGDGAAVQLIVLTLRELPRLTLSCYYLLRGTEWWVPIRLQCAELGLTKALYWSALAAAEEAVHSGLRLLGGKTARAA